MTNEKILTKLESFDPELCGQLKRALKQQRIDKIEVIPDEIPADLLSRVSVWIRRSTE